MNDSDASLVAAIRLGDMSAADALLRRHFRSCYLVAFAQVGSAADAEDVCQDAFIKCLEQIDTCREPANFAAWLTRIVQNTARNRAEYARVRRSEPIIFHLDVESGRRADEDLLRGELRERLMRALSELKREEREVLLLHDLEGLHHAEIAEQLSISVLMSRRRLSDGRKKMRELLGDYDKLEPDHD